MTIYDLAIKLHWAQCRYNHTDQCAWDYELVDGDNKWQRSAHKRWLDKAFKLEADTDMPIADLIKVLKALEPIR